MEESIKTEYESLRDDKMQDPEFRAKYILAKEKLNLELMLDSVRESVRQNKDSRVVMRNINKMYKYISNITL